jgi:signal transduction histidine kinase
MLWIIVSLLFSSFFIKPKYVIAQYFVIVSIVLIFSIGIFNIDLVLLGQEISVTTIVMALIVMSSFMLEHYVAQVIEKNAELDRRTWELEVYTKLLRHDLRNDMQSIVAAVGLSQMTLDNRIEVARKSLKTSLSVAESVIKLLEAFSVPSNVGSMDFVALIEKIASAAQETHKGLKITVKASDKARESKTTASRLMPLVWSNIFRNAAQHAGPNAEVAVDIQQRNNMLHIIVSDNGPGVNPLEREWLFVRGKKDESSEGGIGLYLVRIIIESHGGSIQLVDTPDLQGFTFQITMPIGFSPA